MTRKIFSRVGITPPNNNPAKDLKEIRTFPHGTMHKTNKTIVHLLQPGSRKSQIVVIGNIGRRHS
uniref:Uncharacterized protein n=1 Tax=Rhizophora mucronata TaxID=61149 RepID=A0A2P2PFM2_RHIMU